MRNPHCLRGRPTGLLAVCAPKPYGFAASETACNPGCRARRCALSGTRNGCFARVDLGPQGCPVSGFWASQVPRNCGRGILLQVPVPAFLAALACLTFPCQCIGHEMRPFARRLRSGREIVRSQISGRSGRAGNSSRGTSDPPLCPRALRRGRPGILEHPLQESCACNAMMHRARSWLEGVSRRGCPGAPCLGRAAGYTPRSGAWPGACRASEASRGKTSASAREARRWTPGIALVPALWHRGCPGELQVAQRHRECPSWAHRWCVALCVKALGHG